MEALDGLGVSPIPENLWDNASMAVGGFSETSRTWPLIRSVAVIACAVTIAIYPLQRPPPSLPGYTTSLALILLPLAALLVWLFRCRDRLVVQRKALGRVVFWVFPAWVGVDIFLAHRLFCFSKHSTIQLNLPGYAPATSSCAEYPAAGWGLNIPVEEVVFYLGSCLVMLLIYIWSSDEWFEAYSTPQERLSKEEAAVGRALRIDKSIVILGLLLLAAVLSYKRWGVHPWRDGLPLYAFLLIGFSIVPTAFLYKALGRFVNERALLFTMTVVVLVSLIWEVTLALPNGWWNYQREQMMGLTITPWSDLPIEAVVLWVAAGWGNVIMYEFFRFKLHCRLNLGRALLGE